MFNIFIVFFESLMPIIITKCTFVPFDLFLALRGTLGNQKYKPELKKPEKTKAWDGVAGFFNPKTRKMKDKKSNFQFEIPAEGYLDIRIKYHPDPGRRKKQPRRRGFFWFFSVVRIISEIVRVFF